MKTTLDNIKNFFTKKENGEQTELAPIGVCGPCWGRSEWEGQYYELKKDKNNIPGSEIYESFISKIADKHIKITKKRENVYVCTSCDKEI